MIADTALSLSEERDDQFPGCSRVCRDRCSSGTVLAFRNLRSVNAEAASVGGLFRCILSYFHYAAYLANSHALFR